MTHKEMDHDKPEPHDGTFVIIESTGHMQTIDIHHSPRWIQTDLD